MTIKKVSNNTSAVSRDTDYWLGDVVYWVSMGWAALLMGLKSS
ncbi:hypothetical protein [Vulcanisaeta sp. JCM 16159]